MDVSQIPKIVTLGSTYLHIEDVFYVGDDLPKNADTVVVGNKVYYAVQNRAKKCVNKLSAKDVLRFYKDPRAEKITEYMGEDVVKEYRARVVPGRKYVRVESPSLHVSRKILYLPEFDRERSSVPYHCAHKYWLHNKGILGVMSDPPVHVALVPICKDVFRYLQEYLIKSAQKYGWYAYDDTFEHCDREFGDCTCLAVRIEPPVP